MRYTAEMHYQPVENGAVITEFEAPGGAPIVSVAEDDNLKYFLGRSLHAEITEAISQADAYTEKVKITINIEEL